MKRRLVPVLVALVALLLSAPSAASAAPTLSFTEAKQDGTPVYRTDERAIYLITLKNTGNETTSGLTSVAFDLPAGVEFGYGEAPLWTCHSSASTCTTTQAKAPGTEFATLRVIVWLYPELAPDTITAGFTAYGGGAPSDAFAQDSFTLGPRKPFEITNFAAAACSEPPVAPASDICSGVLGSDEFVEAGVHPFGAASRGMFSTRLLGRAPTLTGAGPYDGIAPVEDLRDFYFNLPAGFIGNPEAVPGICTLAEVRAVPIQCPASAAVGGLDVETQDDDVTLFAPLYRIVPEDGYVAAFATKPAGINELTYVLRAELRSNGDYGVTAVAPLAPQRPWLLGVKAAALCSYGVKVGPGGIKFEGCKKPVEAGANPIPFLTNPSRCAGEAPTTTAHIDSWQNPGVQTDEGFPELSDPNWKTTSAVGSPGTGCVALTEAWTGTQEPSFSFQPDSDRAAASAAYTANLHIPQDGLTEPDGTATAHLKDTTVTLPEGIALNPSAADGLGVCMLAQVGYLGNDFPSPNRIHFKTTAPGCPASSKVGTAEVKTPVLADPLPGSVYLAAQDENPFGSRFAVYLVIDDAKTGIKATIPGKVMPDPVSGRIATVFKDNPQAPVEDVTLRFFGGPRASLANPDVCAGYTTQTQLSPWSAVDPDAPTPDELATPSDTVTIKSPAAGQASCPGSKAQRAFAPSFEAGSVDLAAGGHTRFALRITRGEGEQELSGVKVTTPPGFAATLKGVATCSAAQIAATQAPGRTGKQEIANPSCPASSQVGTTTVGAGAGPTPVYVKTGRAYLSGPYKGAPLSLTFIVPAVAGPFDLGVQVVRTALNIDPRNAQVTAVSDPLPQILEGVPLQVRDIRVELDRPGFALNPTNCEPLAIAGEIAGGSGAVAQLGSRFQVGDCDKLAFKPKLKLELHGATRRAAYQRLVATVSYPPGPGYANIARAAVTLPSSAFLAQEHIRTVCTRVQFAADQCPPGSIYGRAEATTPLLDGKLTGPVYLRSSSNKLPDLVVALRGPDAQPIEVELAGRTDSKNGGIRNTFDVVPDAPVSSFRLELFGGKKSLIVNSRNLCNGVQRATVRFGAQNGMQRNLRPVVHNDCGGKGTRVGKKRGRENALLLLAGSLISRLGL